MNPEIRWKEKSKKNISKWGMQDMNSLLLATMEELGELTQAYLNYKNSSFDITEEESILQMERIKNELDDLAALMFQMDMIL